MMSQCFPGNFATPSPKWSSGCYGHAGATGGVQGRLSARKFRLWLPSGLRQLEGGIVVHYWKTVVVVVKGIACDNRWKNEETILGAVVFWKGLNCSTFLGAPIHLFLFSTLFRIHQELKTPNLGSRFPWVWDSNGKWLVLFIILGFLVLLHGLFRALFPICMQFHELQVGWSMDKMRYCCDTQQRQDANGGCRMPTKYHKTWNTWWLTSETDWGTLFADKLNWS